MGHRLLGSWTLAVLLAGTAAASVGDGSPVDAVTTVSSDDVRIDRSEPASENARTTTGAVVVSTSVSTSTSTSLAPEPPNTATTASPPFDSELSSAPSDPPPDSEEVSSAPPPAAPGDVPMPPGPFTPRQHVPPGHIPAVNDGFILFEPSQPQTDDVITRQEGGLFTLQGRVTDEAGNLLSGICVRVDHPAFGEMITGADGVFRFVVDPSAIEEPALGFLWEIWDCVPGGSPDYANIRTSIGHITPGDTSTWFWRLLAASQLEATIVDRSTGLPVSGICVTAFRSARTVQPPPISPPSGPDGRVTLHGVAPWDLSVTATPCGGGMWQSWSQTLPFRPEHTVYQRIELDPA